MRLQRNLTGRNKYTVTHNETGAVYLGEANTRDEFFVLKLKDRHARAALLAYAAEAEADDPEFARDVRELADRAGERSPWCQRPD